MGKTPSTENTLVIIVTYGARFDLVRETIEAVDEIGIENVLVIDNASTGDSSRKLTAISDGFACKLSMIRHEQNRGSAGGIYAGLKASLEMSGIHYVWLLDDDNKPLQDAFRKLIEAYEYLGSSEKYGLLSLRESRREYRDAVRFGDSVGITKGAFLGFDITRRISRVCRKRSKHPDSKHYAFPLLKIGYAPYGGFLFSKSMLNDTGLPLEALFLYSDDHEFSMRWYDHGGAIYLCAKSKINELEPSWGGETKSRVPVIMNSASDESKLYYFLRNRFYLESRDRRSGFRYGINALIYVIYVSIYALVKEKNLRIIIKRLKLIYAAYKEGASGVFLSSQSSQKNE